MNQHRARQLPGAFCGEQAQEDRSGQRNCGGVATLHQPRSSIYALIDDLLLAPRWPGRIPRAPGERAILLLEKLDFPCPSNTNPAEHMIDLVSIDYTSSDATEESKARIERLTELFSDSKKKEGLASQSASAARSVGGV